MTGHRFRRADGNLAGMPAEDALDGDGFDAITQGCRGAVGVDVVDLMRLDPGVAQAILHHAAGTVAVLGWRRNVIGVGAHAVADNFRQDVCAALLGSLQIFQHHNACAFSDHKAVAFAVPGTAGALRRIIALRERAHGSESADAHRGDAGFGAAANHHIGIAALDEPERIADGVRAGSAGGGGRGVGPLGAGADGDVA